MMASFYYYGQDPSGFCFLVQIRAFCYLNLTGVTQFKYEKKTEKNSGRSSKMTSPCKWSISRTIDFMRLAGTYFHEFQKYLGRYFDQNLYLKSRIKDFKTTCHYSLIRSSFVGILCRIAIENNQTPVPEVTNLLCGLMEEVTNSKGMKHFP